MCLPEGKSAAWPEQKTLRAIHEGAQSKNADLTTHHSAALRLGWPEVKGELGIPTEYQFRRPAAAAPIINLIIGII